MPTITDVFSQDAFSFNSLTAALNNMPFQETRLGEMGLFGAGEGVETDTVVIDETNGYLQLLSTQQRGAPPQRATKDPKHKSRAIVIPHIPFEDQVTAASLFGKRNPGETTMESVARKVNDRAQKMRQAVELTWEVHRLNALRGILLDKDGSEIYDFFDFFGVAQQTHNYAFTTATTDVRDVTQKAIRKIRDTLGGVSYNGVSAICGKNFFDNLIAHPKVRDTYLNWEAAAQLRDTTLNRPFMFGGVAWEEYRGMEGFATPTLAKVDDDEAIMFPTGVMDMYRTYFAPGDFMETVNTLGQPMYMKAAPDWKYNRYVDLLVETNPLYINTRPRAVLRVTAS